MTRPTVGGMRSIVIDGVLNPVDLALDIDDNGNGCAGTLNPGMVARVTDDHSTSPATPKRIIRALMPFGNSVIGGYPI